MTKHPKRELAEEKHAILGALLELHSKELQNILTGLDRIYFCDRGEVEKIDGNWQIVHVGDINEALKFMSRYADGGIK